MVQLNVMLGDEIGGNREKHRAPERDLFRSISPMRFGAAGDIAEFLASRGCASRTSGSMLQAKRSTWSVVMTVANS